MFSSFLFLQNVRLAYFGLWNVGPNSVLNVSQLSCRIDGCWGVHAPWTCRWMAYVVFVSHCMVFLCRYSMMFKLTVARSIVLHHFDVCP